MTEYATFRQRLDAVLRTLDVKQVQEFMLAEKQWSPGAPSNLEFAMYMMIAGTPTLSDLHPQARTWLLSHGHEAEAEAVLGKQKKPAGQRPRTTGKGQINWPQVGDRRRKPRG